MSEQFAVSVVIDDTSSTMSVSVSGEFDAARVAQFDRRADTLPDDVKTVVVDLSETTLVDSSALGALVRLSERCTANGIVFQTVVSRPFQIRLFQITGLTAVLSMIVAAGEGDDRS